MNRLWVSLVGLLALGACDNTPAGTDAGPRPDAPVGTDSGPPTTPVLRVVTMRDAEGTPTEFADANYSCTPSAPAGAGAAAFTVVAQDFFDSNPVEGLTVHFFPDNLPSLDGTCTGSCQVVTTNATGEASVNGTAGAWYAYRVLAGTGINTGTPSEYIGVVQVNEVSPADGGEENLNVVKAMTRNLILTLLGTSAEDGTGVITGQAADCDGRAVANATLRVFDSAGEIELGFRSSGPRAFYFNGESLPLGAQRRTNTDGLYGAANLPLPADNTFRVELWGTLTEGAPATMLGCERVQVGADGITIINVGPERTDGPSGCSE